LPRVRVRLYATLRERAGGRLEVEVEVPEGAMVLDALRAVEAQAPGLLEEIIDSGRVREGYKVMVDGRDVDFEGGLKRRLRGGEVIHVFPPLAGGMGS